MILCLFVAYQEGKMDGKPIKILLVEDDPEDAQLLKEVLTDLHSAQFELTEARQLAQCLKDLSDKDFDLVLLDLSLPDEQGLNTLITVRNHESAVPIIVFTGLNDEELSIKALQAGAQDYLIKGHVDGNLLSRSIRYAIERHRLQIELEQTRRRQQQEWEFSSLDQLQTAQTPISAQFYGVLSLNRSMPEAFNELVESYCKLMDLALEKRAYKVDHNISENLRTIADQLGYLKAGPRDVVEIHRTSLKRMTEKANLQRALAYVEEGRLMALELMGYLVSYYRNRSMGTKNNATDSSKGKVSKEMSR
jgi:DNA-binding response OmpR family regulator